MLSGVKGKVGLMDEGNPKEWRREVPKGVRQQRILRGSHPNKRGAKRCEIFINSNSKTRQSGGHNRYTEHIGTQNHYY